jgi:arylamine N-acetyltransferase
VLIASESDTTGSYAYDLPPSKRGERVQANDYTNESVHSLFDAHLTRGTNNFDQKQYNLTHQTEQLHFNIERQYIPISIHSYNEIQAFVGR